MDDTPITVPNTKIEKLKDSKFFLQKLLGEIYNHEINWNKDPAVDIALIAMNHCFSRFDQEIGSFTMYSRTHVKNTVISYLIKLNSKFEFIEEKSPLKAALDTLTFEETEKYRELISAEIDLFQEELKDYKISFPSILSGAPQNTEDKNLSLNLAFYCISNVTAQNHIESKHKLPINHLSKTFHISASKIKSLKKYILSLFLIFSVDDYFYLRSYLDIRLVDHVS